jgi:hypothetical protein
VRFGPWLPLEQAPEVAPESAGVLQARGDVLGAFPRGKSAMVLYAGSSAGETLRAFVRDRAGPLLAAAAGRGARWIRFAETDRPEDRLARLLRQFDERFGALPPANRNPD